MAAPVQTHLPSPELPVGSNFWDLVEAFMKSVPEVELPSAATNRTEKLIGRWKPGKKMKKERRKEKSKEKEKEREKERDVSRSPGYSLRVEGPSAVLQVVRVAAIITLLPSPFVMEVVRNLKSIMSSDTQGKLLTAPQVFPYLHQTPQSKVQYLAYNLPDIGSLAPTHQPLAPPIPHTCQETGYHSVDRFHPSLGCDGGSYYQTTAG